MTDELASSYRAYEEAQAAANAARGSTQPTLRNTPEPGTPEADRVAALDAAAAVAWDRYCAAVLAADKPEAEPDLEADDRPRPDPGGDRAGRRRLPAVVVPRADPGSHPEA